MCLRVMRLWVSELQVKQASLNVIKTFVRLRCIIDSATAL